MSVDVFTPHPPRTSNFYLFGNVQFFGVISDPPPPHPTPLKLIRGWRDYGDKRSERCKIAGHPFNVGFKVSLSWTPYLYKSRGKSSNNMIYLPMNKIMASLHYLVFCCYSSWLMKKTISVRQRYNVTIWFLGYLIIFF